MKRIFLISAVACLLMTACHHPERMFTAVSSSMTHIDFENTLPDRPGLGILSYIYYYNGGGVAVGDINNDGLPDIYFTANSRGHNKLYLNKGHFEFEDITDKAGVGGKSDWCTGVTMADVNGDGLLDIYVCAVANLHGLEGHNELFINNGNGTFTESAAVCGLAFSGFSTQSVFFDYDHDGDLDCFLINQSEHPNQHIVDTSNRRKFDPSSGERLYRNDPVNGQPRFTDVSASAGIYQSSLCYGLGVGVADLNNDGWEDIYVGNDFHENDYYYINDHDGTFTESGAKHFRHFSRYSMGNDIADFNNDGQPDVVTADMLPGDEKTLKTYGNGEHFDTYNQKITRNGYQDQYSRNCLQMNNGSGSSFSDVGLISGISATDWSWSPLLADFDNDGNKDLFVSSGIVKRPLDLDFVMFFANIRNPQAYGTPAEYQQAMLNKMPGGASHPFFFQGDGHMNFTDESHSWGTDGMKGFYNGAAYADLDNDGNLDVIINCLEAPAVILKNDAKKKSSLVLSFKGSGMNTAGIGAKAYLFTNRKLQYQQLMMTRGFMSSGEARMHFGTDSLKRIDSLLIVWPDQKYQLLKNIPAGGQVTIKQSDASGIFDYDVFFPHKKNIASDISSEVDLPWVHRENNYLDFNEQYLIPHLESTRGPRIAVSDVNRDGLEDMFVCGASGQAGVLMLQTKSGKFLPSDSAVFNRNKLSENIDAVFLDVNKDGYPDLYVVSGGNEYDDGNPALADHLYINDRKGHFTDSPDAIPAILKNKSCVAAADINNDGYPDLFVGGMTVAKKYGLVKDPSYLLINNGKGHFTIADSSTIPLQQTGIVTAAAFADVDRDGWNDLVVAGEWMGVKIFLNHKGAFKASEIGHSTGLWQTIFVSDVNADGFPDILAGNWGHNSKLFAGKSGDLKLYVKDFDSNGTIEQLMTYTIDGKEYPFYGKDQLELALPSLKRNHLSYDEVAGQPVQYLFGEMFSDYTLLNAETLSSSCFINDGKGNFTRHDLPEELQLAPLFSFNSFPSAGGSTYLASGNFYGVMPYEGRYDALNPTFFCYDNKGKGFRYMDQLPALSGEFRDEKWIDWKGRKVLAVARNNDRLIFLKAASD